MLLSPTDWPFNLELLPPDSYLVGGAVRDALLKRKREYLDLDFVLPTEAIAIARKIAKIYKGGFVVLDEARQIARVVFPQGTVDLAQMEGKYLLIDLKRRDYTINAIAYNPHTSELIDPLGGLKDLEKRQIRMISPQNLEDDPLRLLRAYRQAAQLNFTIEENTQLTIRKLAPLLTKVAAERVQTEINYLLTNPKGSPWLQQVYQDGLLSLYFPNLTPEKVELLPKIDQLAQIFKVTWSELAAQSPAWYSLAKLAILVTENPAIAETELVNLKYSRAEIKTVITALKYLPTLQQAPVLMSLREQYFLFLNTGEVFPILALLAGILGGNQSIINELMTRYLDPLDPVAHPTSLVNGNDLIKYLKISPSPKIRYLLTEITVARIEGKITTFEEALTFAKTLLQSL